MKKLLILVPYILYALLLAFMLQCADSGKVHWRWIRDTPISFISSDDAGLTNLDTTGEVIIDNQDRSVSRSGYWFLSSAANPFGKNSYYTYMPGATFTWLAKPMPGDYQVALWWTSAPRRTTVARVDIFDGDALRLTVTINQTAGGGTWNILGTVPFTDQARVIITAGPGGTTSADAVRFSQTAGAGNIPPTAVMKAVPTTGTMPLTVAFDASESSDPDGTIVSYSWDFGNGDTSTEPIVDYAYARAGTYPVTLTVTDNAGETGTAAQSITVTESGYQLNSMELNLVAEINAARRNNGLAELIPVIELNRAARSHSVDMAQSNYFSHDSLTGATPFDRMRQEGYDFRAAAENIAAGYSSAREVVQGWLNSPGHRMNMLNPRYTEMGVGYGYSVNSSYRHYWTLDLGVR